jgi:hypothetical protein
MHWNRQRGYALGITFCVIATLVGVAITTDPFGLLPFNAKLGGSIEPAHNGDYRVGAIIFQIDPYRCQEIKFDNFTGRFSEAGPCDSKVIGSDGTPMPMGAFDRLESIRNSFAGSRQIESSSK